MSQVNMGRVIGGGLLAGLVMNISEAALHGGVLAQDGLDLYKSMGWELRAEPMHLVSVIAITFVLGITAVWLYAAIRPRFGPGPKTAICAGLVVWVLAHLWSGVYIFGAYPGMVPAKLVWLPVVWGLVEAPLGTFVGAWLYKE